MFTALAAIGAEVVTGPVFASPYGSNPFWRNEVNAVVIASNVSAVGFYETYKNIR